MKKFSLLFLVSFLFTALLMAQTPQYYTSNTGTSSNSFPFNVTGGKAVNSLILAGEFILPTPLPSGQQITKVYFRHSTATARVLTNFHILMAQDVLTTLTTGAFYPGPWDTVYFSASANLNASAGAWSMVTLDHPFPYDPTKSLILFVGQCGASGSGGSVYNSTGLSGIRRTWSVGGCPFVPYTGGDASLVNFGVDVEPAVTVCNYYSSQWCALSAFPNLPSATFYQAAAWLGDTLYVQTPTTTGAAATTVYRYTYGGSWSTGSPIPVAKAGGTLTKCGSKLYFIGGGSSVSTGSTDVYEYDPATGIWTTKAPMPMALSGHGTVNWGDSVLFVIGGPWSNSGTNLSVHYYRPASNTWGTISNSLPSGQGRRSHAVGIVGNKIFMGAGYNTGFLKSFYIGTIGSDASSITWVAGPEVPCGTWTGISRTGGTAYGNYFYIVAGERGGVGGYSDSTFVFNVNTNVWQVVIDDKPNRMSNMWASITNKCINDTLRVFSPGGYNGVGIANFEVIGCGPTIVGNSTIISTTPTSYSLSQNYPNPFNPTTKISFSLPKNGDVKLVVYDILGKEVMTLVNDYRTAGTHQVEFNASNLASGVYLYRIEAGDFKDVKKMMLIK